MTKSPVFLRLSSTISALYSPSSRMPASVALVMLAGLAGCGGGSGSDSLGANASGAKARAAEVTPVVRQTLYWSDAASGLPKTATDVVGVTEVVIPANTDVILDMVPPALPNLRIDGSLTWAEKDIQLKAASIALSGRLQIGSPEQAFAHKATITLTGAYTPPNGVINDGVSRGLNVNGGTLALYGRTPSPIWTKLGDHLAAGSTSAKLMEAANWQVGDQLVVASTDFYGQSLSERTVLRTAANGSTQLTLATKTRYMHWGKLQYMTDSGLSLTPQASYVPPATPAPTVLDERAEVVNTSRNIIIEGLNDSAWAVNGHGAHVMIMGLASKVVLDSIEVRRAGQAGALGRYPIHWHMLSYNPSTGAELGDATGHVIRNSSIWSSANRCVVIHGTNGVQVQNNSCYDVQGHAFFLEDAVERRNVITGNIALQMRNPSDSKALKVHETRGFNESGSSGFWITHPDNTVKGNVAADAQGPGVWLAFPSSGLGLSSAVPTVPRMVPLRDIGYNTAHSNGSAGSVMAFVPVDDAVANPDRTRGTMANEPYNPMQDGIACRGSDGSLQEWCNTQIRFSVMGNVLYKNGGKTSAGAYRSQTMKPDYLEWTTADNAGVSFSGGTSAGSIQRGLIVGTSLNVGLGYPSGVDPQAALATYHSSMTLGRNTIVNFPYVAGKTSGAFSTSDYYLRPVERGSANNPGNRLVNSHAGFHSVPVHLMANHNPAENWTLASALWDPYGYWGPANNYLVFDTPFLTAERSCVSLDGAVAGDGANGKSCAGEYFGVGSFQTEQDSTEMLFTSAINVDRYNPSGTFLGNWRIEDGASTYRDPAVAAAYPCSTVVTPPPGSYCSVMLGSMRNFVTVPDNRYVLTFPTHAANPRWVSFVLSNAYRIGDNFVMAVQFDGRFTAAGYTAMRLQYQRTAPALTPSNYVNYPEVRYFQQAASLNEVLQDTVGNKIWQDRTNNLVWMRHVGTSVSAGSQTTWPEGSEDSLYAPEVVVLLPANANCAGLADGAACLAQVRALQP